MMKERKCSAFVAAVAWLAVSLSTQAGEVLYNGIELPEDWPPRIERLTREPMPVPYLENPPEVIPIEVGRQLFVDDFLIERTSLQRSYHRPTYHPNNPVLAPDKPWEREDAAPAAAPFSDGVFYDPKDKLFKMWYVGGYIASTCLATSRDGIHWEKPSFDVRPGTNEVLSHRDVKSASAGRHRDSSTVWLDPEDPDPQRRFKMFVTTTAPRQWSLALRCSGDGIHWSEPIAVSATGIGDRTTVHYNPFRKKWVFGLRTSQADVGRSRAYFEHSDAVSGTRALANDAVLWMCADRLDPHHPKPEYSSIEPQLYNHDAVAYESLMLGLFCIWQGPPNSDCARLKIQKRNEVLVGFSRDGFHWHRPDRRRFLMVNETEGAWNWGNVQSVGGCCLVVGDKLYFYVSGRALSDRFWDGNCNTGLAIMRRDGFASMDAESNGGELVTRVVTFKGKHLFVNLDAPEGELRAELLDRDGKVISPFTLDNCNPLSGDQTLEEVRWKTAEDLSALAGKPVRFRFQVKSGKLYSFWVSPDKSGASYGYVAAGGPGFTGPTDTVGVAALERRFPQVKLPAFWKGRLEDVDAAIADLRQGKAEVIARSPAGRPVYLVTYGPEIEFHRQANYNSAVGAGDPSFYARKTAGTPPIVFIVGPPHGAEVEGIVGLVNLLRVAETGKDMRGREWPRLKENLERCRLLIVPLSNPDGRARCPYDSLVGVSVIEATRVAFGTRRDGTLYGLLGSNQRHPMKDDVGLLGASFNDDGINLMHDQFLEPMAQETKALLRVARQEAPDYVISLHSYAYAPTMVPTSYVPRYCRETEASFAKRLMGRYRKAGLPAGNPPVPSEDGAKYPPPSFNLSSALHHACGGVSLLFECPLGLKGWRPTRVTHDQIVDIELILFDELLAFALETPRPGKQ